MNACVISALLPLKHCDDVKHQNRRNNQEASYASLNMTTNILDLIILFQISRCVEEKKNATHQFGGKRVNLYT